MDIRLLRYFAVLADELHFGRAAARLHISQPPLSQQIRILEEEMGTALFMRSQHRVELTEAGKTLKEQAPLIFAQFERAIDLTRCAGRGEVGSLEIGIISSAMVEPIPHTLGSSRASIRKCSWTLHEMTPAAQIQALKERRLDVCFFRVSHEDPEISSEVVLRESAVVALPLGHPLPGVTRLRCAIWRRSASCRLACCNRSSRAFCGLLCRSGIYAADRAGSRRTAYAAVSRSRRARRGVAAFIGAAVVERRRRLRAADGAASRSVPARALSCGNTVSGACAAFSKRCGKWLCPRISVDRLRDQPAYRLDERRHARRFFTGPDRVEVVVRRNLDLRDFDQPAFAPGVGGEQGRARVRRPRPR